MSFIQCKSESDVEKQVGGKGGSVGFVSEDFRIYSEIQFYDEAAIHTLDAKEINALLNLKGMIEFLGVEAERPFTQLVKDAEETEKAFRDVQKLLISRRTK